MYIKKGFDVFHEDMNSKITVKKNIDKELTLHGNGSYFMVVGHFLLDLTFYVLTVFRRRLATIKSFG